jgi:hypothetical protein
VLWFSLQDNDYLTIADKSITDWVNPTLEYPVMDKSVKLRFQTDDSLAYNGFWLKVRESETCKSDWQLVGDNCIKVFGEALDWRSANAKCQAMNGYLVKIDDVIGDLKLTQYMNKYCESYLFYDSDRSYLFLRYLAFLRPRDSVLLDWLA